MKKSRGFGLTLALLTTLFWCGWVGEAAAETYSVENNSSHKIRVALLMPTSKGWYVSHWYTLEPFSRKNISRGWANKGKFGYYAQSLYDKKITWGGNSVAIVSDKASDHPYNKNPGGGNVRKVGFGIKNGNSVKLGYSAKVGKSSDNLPPPGKW